MKSPCAGSHRTFGGVGVGVVLECRPDDAVGDGATLVDHLADKGDGPILVVCLAREELGETSPDFLRARGNVDRIELDALSPDETAALVDGLGGGIIESDQRTRVLEAAEGKKLTSQTATTGEKYARDNGLDPVSVETPDLQFNALKSGQADVAIQDLPVVSEWLKDSANSDYEISATIETGEQYGFGVKKGNSALLEVVNSTLAAARNDGTYDAIYTEWIGEVPASAATPATAPSGSTQIGGVQGEPSRTS